MENLILENVDSDKYFQLLTQAFKLNKNEISEIFYGYWHLEHLEPDQQNNMEFLFRDYLNSPLDFFKILTGEQFERLFHKVNFNQREL